MPLVIAAPPSSPSDVGADVVDRRYRILGPIADGGMGRVFLAEHVLIRRRFAIKFLHRELASDLGIVRQFMNEALAAGTLGHSHLVEATDMGFTPEGVPYIVFEYLEGTVLTAEIYRLGGLSLPRALSIAMQIASALECAHEAGIAHLDLKADNVVLTATHRVRDHAKVLDFGTARFLRNELDEEGQLYGTPEYMAPEQLCSPERVGKCADIYALGVLLYEMLSARRPFGGADARVLACRVLYDAPPPLARRDLPPELERVIVERMLAKAPAQRFQSMHEVEEMLRRFLPPPVMALGSSPAIPILAEPAIEPAPLPPPRRRGPLAWLAARMSRGRAS